MNTRRYALVHSILALSALTGCGAGPVEEAAGDQGSAMSAPGGGGLPVGANWANGLGSDAIIAGFDTDGTPLLSCRAAFNGSITPGKTRKDWGACDLGYGGGEQWVGTYQTLATEWTSETGGAIPPNARAFGSEGFSSYYPCRASYAGSLQTGKVGNGIAGCDFPYGGREVTAASYQVLGESNAFGTQTVIVQSGGALPYNAIQGGHEANGTPIYPCTASYNGGIHPGKTEPGWGGCDISWGGAEIWVSGAYTVLVPSFLPTAHTSEYVAGTDSNGTALGVCQASYAGSEQVGKYNLVSGACSFGYGGREVPATSFSVFGVYSPP